MTTLNAFVTVDRGLALYKYGDLCVKGLRNASEDNDRYSEKWCKGEIESE